MTRERGGPHEGYLTIESFQVRRACRSQRGVRAGRCCGQISGSSVVDRHASSARRVDPDIRAICDLVRILLAIWPLTRSLCPGHGGLMGGFSVSGQGCCTCCFAGVCVWHASGCLVGLSVVPRGDRTAALGGGSTPFDWLRLFHTAVSHQYHVKPRAPDSFTAWEGVGGAGAARRARLGSHPPPPPPTHRGPPTRCRFFGARAAADARRWGALLETRCNGGAGGRARSRSAVWRTRRP